MSPFLVPVVVQLQTNFKAAMAIPMCTIAFPKNCLMNLKTKFKKRHYSKKSSPLMTTYISSNYVLSSNDYDEMPLVICRTAVTLWIRNNKFLTKIKISCENINLALKNSQFLL